MNKIKSCPVCNDDSITIIARADMRPMKHGIECSNDECPAPLKTKLFGSFNEAVTAWNTRAAPTMKSWEWVESNAHGPAWKCDAFKALTYLAAGEWHVYIDMIFVGSVVASVQDAPELAKAVGVAYVESKLREWLI